MPKRVLVTPINWGLGHATRCIPIIQELLRQGAEVILASDGRAHTLLSKEFPKLIIEKLPAYNVLYQTNNMIWNMATQSFKISRAILQEHRKLQKLIKKHQIDCVISDNRFGCFSRKARCVFITHQVNIRLPNPLAQWMVRFANSFFMRQYDECWIPDVPGEKSIAGDLSKSTFSSKHRYIGILSRMQVLELPKQQGVIIVLSGPEPQRTRLEAAILQQLALLPHTAVVVQGKPEIIETESRSDQVQGEGQQKIQIIPFLDARQLNEAMAGSEVVICRSGYSTIMDLAILGKKAIFIPTPGQTEQEYLAERLLDKGIFYFQRQAELDLVEALREVKNYTGLQWSDYQPFSHLLKQAVKNFLSAVTP